MDFHQDTLVNYNDFELHDFTDDPNFDQFINLIRGENEDAICNYGSDIINGCFLDNQLLPSCPANPFEYQTNNIAVNVCEPSPTLSSFSCFDRVVNGEREEEHEGEDSSATTTATETVNAKPRLKTDRAKTLISERKRRSRMKDKLYALRSLVPNITKVRVPVANFKAKLKGIN